MFKSKPKPEVIQTKKLLQKSDKKSRSKTATLPVKEDFLLQMKHLKLEDESNIQTLIKNIRSIKKDSRKMEMSSPLASKKGDLDKIEIEEEGKIMGNDEVYDFLYGAPYEKQLYHDEVLNILSIYLFMPYFPARSQESVGENGNQRKPSSENGGLDD